MRGLRSTLALLAVLLGLGAYIYFVASKDEDSASSQDRMFAGLQSDSIAELTVTSESGETTSLKKENGAWQMVAPVAARGSDLEVTGIANALAGLDVTRVVEETLANAGEYGLDTPRIQVAFKTADGKTSGTLRIGSKTATGGSLYARKNDEQKVVLIGQYNEATFNKSTFDLRDKAIVTFDRTKVDGFDATVKGASFEIAKKAEDWSITKPLVARADVSASEGLVSALLSLQMTKIVSSAPTADELKKYGLDAPPAVVNLHLASARVSVGLGNDAEDGTVYVRDLSKPDVFTIQKTAADDLRKPLGDYRRKELFDMRAFTATRLEITRNGKTTVFEKVKADKADAADTWKRVSPAGTDPDKEKFGSFVPALADVRAIEFVDAGPRTGLSAPVLTIVAKFDDGKKEEKVTFGKTGQDAYAGRTDDPGAARIDTEKLDDILKSVDEFTK